MAGGTVPLSMLMNGRNTKSTTTAITRKLDDRHTHTALRSVLLSKSSPYRMMNNIMEMREERNTKEKRKWKTRRRKRMLCLFMGGYGCKHLSDA